MQTYSVISPLFNVAAYLPEFLGSLEHQTIGFDHLQVILVDDGSTDEGATARIAGAFAARHPDNVVFLSKPNGGQASARNLGLAHATGEWLTFPDPDDVLRRRYFEECEKALAASPDEKVDVVSARIRLWHGRGRGAAAHALDGRFRHGVTLRHVNADPEWIQPHVTSALLRRRVVEDHALRFPEELRLRFEDGAFISDYLLRIDDPTVLFVPRAEYLYRQRSDSTVQIGKTDPHKYVDHLRFGFLPLIERARERHGAVPRWLQNLFLYDQFWILRSSQAGEAHRTPFPDEMYVALAELVPAYLAHVDDQAIRAFSLMPVEAWMRDALAIAKGSAAHGDVVLGTHDARRGLRSYRYRYGTQGRPVERIMAEGREIEPRFSKDQSLEYVGRPIAWQRTLWLPDDVEFSLELDGKESRILARESEPDGPYSSDETRLAAVWRARWQTISREGTRAGIVRAAQFARRTLDSARGELARRSTPAARKFGHAWVFIDRDVDAADSAEDMYFWVREHHPEVNAWFVIRRDSPDWSRLESRGARLVEYRSSKFIALMAHADHLASSHADRFITDVLPRRMRGRYVFTFLQHGVIKGDISEWLNRKRIDVFVTSTQAEYDYIVGPSPFAFGAKEVRLTGLPRHDALLRLAERRSGSPARTILIMPTWRDYLVGDMGTTSADRERVAAFSQSLYSRSWQEFLRRPEVAGLAAQGNELVFMPHPNMHGYLDEFPVPPFVRRVSYADENVRELLVGSTALVTDYSSVAFNAAYLHIPVLYFQFDAEEYRARHTERDAYFDYTESGFGPVISDARAAALALERIVAEGADPTYGRRMDDAFPVRDGANCERVFRAMVEATRRRPLIERSAAGSHDSWNAKIHPES
nr:CDP-glycerol glycerophosphotransferase family protein [Microbacterium bovistercoris]